MTVWQALLAFVLMGVAALLMIVILLQRGRGGGLAGAFGGAGGTSAFGAKTGDVFTWITVVVASLFVLLSIAANYVFDDTPVAPVASIAASGDAPAEPTSAPAPATTPPSPSGTITIGDTHITTEAIKPPQTPVPAPKQTDNQPAGQAPSTNPAGAPASPPQEGAAPAEKPAEKPANPPKPEGEEKPK